MGARDWIPKLSLRVITLTHFSTVLLLRTSGWGDYSGLS